MIAATSGRAVAFRPFEADCQALSAYCFNLPLLYGSMKLACLHGTWEQLAYECGAQNLEAWPSATGAA